MHRLAVRRLSVNAFPKRPGANFIPLTPLAFIDRARHVFADGPAVVDGDRMLTSSHLYDRCALPGDVLSVWAAPDWPADLARQEAARLVARDLTVGLAAAPRRDARRVLPPTRRCSRCR